MILEENPQVYVRFIGFTKDLRELVLPEQLRYSRVQVLDVCRASNCEGTLSAGLVFTKEIMIFIRVVYHSLVLFGPAHEFRETKMGVLVQLVG
jgi:hypothetical protein